MVLLGNFEDHWLLDLVGFEAEVQFLLLIFENFMEKFLWLCFTAMLTNQRHLFSFLLV